METVKTIVQYDTTYYINRIGNCSFRIAFRWESQTNRRLQHIDHVFDSEAECCEYIKSIAHTDAMGAQLNAMAHDLEG